MAEMLKLTGEQLRRMQLLELDMLKELDRVCRKHGIVYTLSSGTMLGAIRHHGFIPWDDDADVTMLREEYDKFVAVANELNPQICYFQDHGTDPEYRWGYAKLRRTGTQYVRVGQEHLKCRTGIFVDIFPMDDVPQGILARKLQQLRCFITRKLMYSEVGRLSKGESPFMRWVYSVMSKVPIDFAFRRLEKYTRRSRNDTPNVVRVLTFAAPVRSSRQFPRDWRYGLPKSWYLEVAEYCFEGAYFFGPKDFDGYLRFKYGDYMTPPPENHRQQNSPVSFIDFGDK